jgi:MSHA biogenesis protein MshP
MTVILSNNYNRSKIKLSKLQTNQHGSALMLSLFIIIVLTLFGSALVKVLSTSSESIAQEVIGTRALMAANSAMQAELSVLFPLATDAAIPHPAGICNASNTHNLPPSGSDIPGLYHCRASTTCDPYHTQDLINYYRLTSTGECGSSDISADSKNVVRSSRTIQVEARSL